MRAGLSLGGVAQVASDNYFRKYLRIRLSNGQYGATASVEDAAAYHRRDHIVRVRSHVHQVGGRGRGVQRVPAHMQGAVAVVDVKSSHWQVVSAVPLNPQKRRFIITHRCDDDASNTGGATLPRVGDTTTADEPSPDALT